MSDFIVAFLVLVALATAGTFASGGDAMSGNCTKVGWFNICK